MPLISANQNRPDLPTFRYVRTYGDFVRISQMMLAQVNVPVSTVPVEPGAGQFAWPEIPSQDQIVDTLLDLTHSQYGAVLAMLLFACGLIYMLQGWKIFKILVIANVAVLGAAVGNYLGSMARGQDTWMYTSIAGAMLLGGLAWPLMKYAVSLLGGIVGSLVGYGLWYYVANAADRPEMLQYSWVGALVGLITLGLLALVILKFVVMIVTSIQGAVMALGGVLAMMLKYMAEDLEGPLRDNDHLMVILIGVPAVIGFVFQACWSRPPKKKDGSSIIK